ncbi:MAG: 6,7-dimethyl-8-ribityllumazine synthase [Aquificaceae bacterium]|nr:6,7-dimethyl-8-ribityllumazine synthase [Aquificaceae bacterium]MDW8236894.1 6,7-dimethyl-8-ribityllumazine synthase [Aquificaceae bacterium]
MKVFEGKLIAENMTLGIVASRFNHLISDRLVEGAIDCFIRHGGTLENLVLAKVPGSWEVALAVKNLLPKVEGVLALSVLIRGQTAHFDYIANELTKGLAQISLEMSKPVTYGVITADNLEQALERAGSKHGNRGWEGMLALIEMVNLLKQIK